MLEIRFEKHLLFNNLTEEEEEGLEK